MNIQPVRLVLFSILVIFCQVSKAQDYFEGYINYKAEYKSYIPGVSDNELKDRMGNFVRIYYKGADFKWELRDDAGYIRNYMLFVGRNNTTYSWSDSSPDTLYSFDVSSTRRMRVDSLIEGEKEKVLDCDCQQIIMKGFCFYETDADSIAILFRYYFCPAIKINPDGFKNYNEIRWNEVVKRTGSVSIKIIAEYKGFYTETHTAETIHPEKLNDILFRVDDTKKIKKTFE